MANREISKISYDCHLLLDQSLLRLPYELLRKNFRAAHFTFEKESSAVKSLLKDTAKGSLDGKASPEDVVRNLDSMLAKMRGMKRKLSAYAEEESRLYHQVDARVAHVCELSEIGTVEDVKYEAWSRQRLDRLLVDYLLRYGYDISAAALAKERGIQDLVDIDTFVAMNNIRFSLLNASEEPALAWCQNNKKELRKMQSNLEFMLRCQQYVEMMRTWDAVKMAEAIVHAKKYIVPCNDTHPIEVRHMAGLLAYRADTKLEPYASWYAPSRWSKLAEIFVVAHNKLLGLPSVPLLHIALSMGLSALKTPACHGKVATTGSSGGDHSTPSETAVRSGTGKQGSTVMSLTTNVCPICSTELNELARNVPYAHHTKSHVANDLLVLPNDRVYGEARLAEYAAKASLSPGLVKDLVTGELYEREKLKKVFIT